MRSEVNCQLPETDRFYSPSDLNPTEHQVELKTVWQKTLRRAKVPYFRIYDLRSTYATRLSAGGVAAEWVTQLLRQGDSQVFKRYSQMKLQMKREALEKINRQANEMPLDSGTAMFSEIYLAQLEAPAPCPSSRSKAVTAQCAVARPLGPSGSSSATATMQRRWRSSIDPISVGVTSICRRRAWVRLLPDERLDS